MRGAGRGAVSAAVGVMGSDGSTGGQEIRRRWGIRIRSTRRCTFDMLRNVRVHLRSIAGLTNTRRISSVLLSLLVSCFRHSPEDALAMRSGTGAVYGRRHA